MSVIIHCIRHAQGYHNLGHECYAIPDPKLTPLGQQQCLDLQLRSFPAQSKINLITASPLSRTIDTAFQVFGPALKGGHAPGQIFAIPDAQETSDYPCDIGSTRQILEKKCVENQWSVDLSLVRPDWEVKTGRNSPSIDAIDNRARETRLLLRQKARELLASGQQQIQIVLVTHGSYLHYLTGDWENFDKLPGSGWDNCETRAYTFEAGPESQDLQADMVETVESRQSRSLDYPMLPKQVQKELRAKCMAHWEREGTQKVDILTELVQEDENTTAGPTLP